MPDSGSGASGWVVAYREGRGVLHWQERNRQSPVPGAWPYGLDQLAGPGRSVEPREVAALTGLRRTLSTIMPRRRGDSAVAALSWDENTAGPMMTGINAQRYYCGVIWATDAVAGGDVTTKLIGLRKTLLGLNGLWVLSRPQADRVREWLGPDCPPVHFLRFGIDADFYRPLGYPTTPHVVSAGGDRDRDPETLFAALEIVRASRPDVLCTVQTTSTAPAPDGVTTVAHLPHLQMVDLLGSASVVAIATRPNWHASAMTVGLEAMSVGRPVVVCNTPGMTDYFDEGVTGHLVGTGEVAAMASRILALLDDPAAARSMGEAGREAVQARHTTRSMCADLAAIVEGGIGSA